MRLTKKSLSIIRREGISSLIIRAVRKVYFENKITKNIHRSPTICKLSWIIYSNTIRTTVKLLNKAHPEKYTDANPFKIIYVNPQKISEIAEINYQSYSKSLKYGRVLEGCWDIQTSMKHEDVIDIEGLERFLKGDIDWHETNLPQEFEDANSKWPNTEYERKESLKKLGRRISQRYLTQKELWHKDPKDTIVKSNDSLLPFTNEINVSISRNGRILRYGDGGRHRLALAKILNLEKVPVLVVCRHVEWQKVRDKAREGSTPEEFRDHPDLEDLKN